MKGESTMKMQALMKTKAAPRAEIGEVDVPAIGPTDLLVRVKATAICGTDLHIYNWNAWAAARIKPPMIFGQEFGGDLVQVGSNVTAFKVGDLVAADSHVPCGHCYQCQTGNQHICDTMAILGVHRDGCFAEYISLPQASAWKMAPDASPDLGAIMGPEAVLLNPSQTDVVAAIKNATKGQGVEVSLEYSGNVQAAKQAFQVLK